MVYCHTKATFSPTYFAWMRHARNRLPHRFRKNLAALHIVHPSLFIRAMFGFFRPFISSKFWKKLFYVSVRIAVLLLPFTHAMLIACARLSLPQYSSAQTEKLEVAVQPVSLKEALPPFVLLHAKKNDSKTSLFTSTLENALLRNPDDLMKIPRYG